MKDVATYLEELESIIKKNDDIIGDEARSLSFAYGIDNANEFRKKLHKIEDEERLLQLGVVGRVKSGKSSLINSIIFDGKTVLPEAATPMTASLTILSYGKRVCAEVEYFTDNDIKMIKSNHDKYCEKLEKLTKINFDDLIKNKKKHTRKNNGEKEKEKSELQKIAKNRAKVELADKEFALSAAFDQYERMKETEEDICMIRNNGIIEAKNIEELGSAFVDYVGSKGRFMPYTKSVHIKLPYKELEGLQIVDTPGLNDPVQSREGRTRELLKLCDAVFIVSPAGQFMSIEDVDLMDRITTKEGVQELYVIPSQIDTQLFGSEKDILLKNALENITTKLSGHLRSTLLELKNSNPEVGDTFDQLIENSKEKLIYSSSICQTIKLVYDNKDAWDDGIKTVWDNLSKHYQDNFSYNDKVLSQASLDLLSNIKYLKEILQEVRVKKDNIIKSRQKNFVDAKSKTAINFTEELLKYTKNLHVKIEETDLDEIKKQKSSMIKKKGSVSLLIDDTYAELVFELKKEINGDLTSTLSNYFKDIRKEIKDTKKNEIEEYTVKKEGGLLQKAWWFLISGGYKVIKKEVTTIRTGAIKDVLENLTLDLENHILDKYQYIIENWRKRLYKELTSTLRSKIDDDELDTVLIKSLIRKILNSVIFPDIDYSSDFQDNLKAKGELRSEEAEIYLENVKKYITNMRKRIQDDIKKHIKILLKKIEGIYPSEILFNQYEKQIADLEKKIENKVTVIKRIDEVIGKLEALYNGVE